MIAKLIAFFRFRPRRYHDLREQRTVQAELMARQLCYRYPF
jgi:hypothetical protein